MPQRGKGELQQRILWLLSDGRARTTLQMTVALGEDLGNMRGCVARMVGRPGAPGTLITISGRRDNANTYVIDPYGLKVCNAS